MELGVGYLSIVADTRQMPGQLQKALDGGQAQADKAARAWARKSRAGSADAQGRRGRRWNGRRRRAGGVDHEVLGRLNAIEQAQAKLSGLGNSTQAVGQIMDNASLGAAPRQALCPFIADGLRGVADPESFAWASRSRSGGRGPS
ncbi:hypothetical protein GS928_25370 [Rhodococcus hoagii]|nr:hypothetical protein [Prescottella equi]